MDAATSISMIAVLSRGAHAAGGLVEQDDLGPQGEGRGHVEQLLVALGQLARRRVALVGEAEQLGHLQRARLHLAVAAPATRRAGVPRPRRETTAAWSVSSTVSSGKIWTSWKLRASPSRASADRADAADVAVLEAHRAGASGASTPVSTLISVDLPAPLGPMIETNSPGSTARLTPSRAQKSP